MCRLVFKYISQSSLLLFVQRAQVWGLCPDSEDVPSSASHSRSLEGARLNTVSSQKARTGVPVSPINLAIRLYRSETFCPFQHLSQSFPHAPRLSSPISEKFPRQVLAVVVKTQPTPRGSPDGTPRSCAGLGSMLPFHQHHGCRKLSRIPVPHLSVPSAQASSPSRDVWSYL